MRSGYADESDCCPPDQLRTALHRERIERQRKHASRTIPEGLDHAGVRRLRAEARGSSRGSGRGHFGRHAAAFHTERSWP